MVNILIHCLLIRKITNLFKHANLYIAFRATNMIPGTSTTHWQNSSDLHKFQRDIETQVWHLQQFICRTIRKVIETRHKEHTRYISTDNPISAYALHILNNRHQYGSAEETLELLKPCNKGTKINSWESFCMLPFTSETYWSKNRGRWHKSSIRVGSTRHITSYEFPDSVYSRTVRHTHINKGKSCQFRYDLIWKSY